MTGYEGWSATANFKAVAQIGTGPLTRSVLKVDFRATVGGTGSIEFRLFDVDSGRATPTVFTLSPGAGQWVTCEWLHGLAAPPASGGWRRVLLQARVSAGAPSLSVWLGLASGVSTTTAPAATSAGTWAKVSAPAGY
ncbi:hypothetical protein OU787_17350 [Kitasatospora sp. YST-16]|uniref:hypothetical protein n=1 Tax=Kitasatospora sp. YST-16 TaxID=2998080 RepID=UPI00228515D8|nr:hypothetical protein [Kitasatospora sp. YST-16]WAL73116.1 hypothetical protein OU787_17350 [Kitasatospora sp. YST-16]WNW39170.1 hypothetical protein RKE32_17315 [Streptomyces sp. Li-HN-5-13]